MNVYPLGEQWLVETFHSKEEYWDLTRKVNPRITWEEFEREDWPDLLASIVRRGMN